MSSDATSVALFGQPSAVKKQFWKLLVVRLGLLGLGGLSFLALILLGFFSSISGTEMDALTWQSRSFQYMRDPVTLTQLTGIRHDTDYSLDPVIAPYIKGGSLAPSAPRWDLVVIYRGTEIGFGPARVLLQYLQAANSDGKPYWAQWTSRHPQAASVLWPAIRDCVHLPRYDRLPQLFEAARAQSDHLLLQVVINGLMHDLAVDEARRLDSAGQVAEAARAAALGLLYQPDSSELKQFVAPKQ